MTTQAPVPSPDQASAAALEVLVREESLGENQYAVANYAFGASLALCAVCFYWAVLENPFIRWAFVIVSAAIGLFWLWLFYASVRTLLLRLKLAGRTTVSHPPPPIEGDVYEISIGPTVARVASFAVGLLLGLGAAWFSGRVLEDGSIRGALLIVSPWWCFGQYMLLDLTARSLFWKPKLVIGDSELQVFSGNLVKLHVPFANVAAFDIEEFKGKEEERSEDRATQCIALQLHDSRDPATYCGDGPEAFDEFFKEQGMHYAITEEYGTSLLVIEAALRKRFDRSPSNRDTGNMSQGV